MTTFFSSTTFLLGWEGSLHIIGDEEWPGPGEEPRGAKTASEGRGGESARWRAGWRGRCEGQSRAKRSRDPRAIPLMFRNRETAGRALAAHPALQRLKGAGGGRGVVVLGLPRGGVPVALEVARELRAAMDVAVVRKLGVPGHEEYAFGALSLGGVRVLDEQVMAAVGLSHRPDLVNAVVAKETKELHRREAAFRGDAATPLEEVVRGKTVVLVDDGIATGSTMRAAARAVRQLHPARVVVAAPVAPPDSVESMAREADEVIVLAAPSSFQAVGQFYVDFTQTEDSEVKECLKEARSWAS